MPSDNYLTLTGRDLTPQRLHDIAIDGCKVALAPDVMKRLKRDRAVVDRHVDAGDPVYGLTTGLGSKSTEALPRDQLAAFSLQTLRGRAQALGDPLPWPLARAVLVARLNSLCAGGSGASPAVAEILVECLNRGATPVMPQTGSVGASDLCVQAVMGLALTGEGEMFFNEERLPAAEAMQRAGIEPLELGPKDGLAICSSSAFSTGLAALGQVAALRSLRAAQIAAAMTMEGFRANCSPLREEALRARPQPGQITAGEELKVLLSGGLLLEGGAARRLQDPLSIRCLAQTHGAVYGTLDFLAGPLTADLNGSSDNPLLTESGEMISNGNFQAPLLGIALDSVARALSGLATASLARIARLLSPALSGLPRFLSLGGSESAGFAPLMKPAEALVGEITLLANPAPLANSSSAEGVEDILTHTPISARKLLKLLNKLDHLIAIELLFAAQAIELANPDPIAPRLAAVLDEVRKISPTVELDRPLGREIEAVAASLVGSGRLLVIADIDSGADQKSY
ncbi:histidine ammonia-lyase [Pelagibius sp. Alg239-R121]|uniref:HAL/PAL/TAL family ammonia-lyase n=1 Tax=Pelagibius sp. Alg239-R121 TaxID=2993448 RepID=UPI0024A79DB7|nr:aromatic amino acid lyase [Pelagibius sp. Alg239-R121]